MSSLRAGPWAHRASRVAHGVSAFSPRETNPEIWIDADLTAGLSDGDPVGTVPDLSGHGRHFIPNGSAPLWVAGGPAGPVFLFDGIDDSLQWNALGLTLTPPFTVLAVAQNQQGTDDGGEHSIWDLTSGGNEYAFRAFYTFGPGPWFALPGPVGTGYITSTVPSTDTTWRVWTCEVAPLGKVRTQGRYDVAVAGMGWDDTKPFISGAVNIGSRVAAQRPWKGPIKAVLFWNRALSVVERYNLERYYAAKIGMAVTPHVPTDVAGLRLWLRPSTLDLAEGALVAQQTDHSGLLHHAAQAVAGKRPIFWRRGWAGKPVVAYDGIDDELVSPYAISAINGYSMMGAFAPQSLPAGLRFLCGYGNANGSEYAHNLTINGASSFTLYDFGATPNQASYGTPELRVPVVLGGTVSRLADGAFQMHLNGVAAPAVPFVGTLWNGQTYFVIGSKFGSSHAAVEIGDLVAYDHGWSPQERLIVEDYFGRESGVAL